ncbi:MAG: P27 family phage terminase small subunit [Ketobacter sp.]|nr:P27 family phage terminase small subunit [Ketobacter sp.]
MGRPKIPTNILKLKGADKKDPARFIDRENEPENKNPVGDPPEHFTDAECEAWRTIVKESIDGVLGEADRQLVEMSARLMVSIRSEDYYHNHWVLLNKCLGQMGMTPSERTKISVPKKKPKNKFDD